MEPFSQSPPLFETRIRSLKKIHQGKVRDIYDVDADHLACTPGTVTQLCLIGKEYITPLKTKRYSQFRMT